MRKNLIIISAATMGLLGTAAVAQNAVGPMADKTVTRAEAEAKAGEHFAKADVNKDGKLDKADREVRMGEHFKKMDSDGNGSISQAEFAAAHQGKGMRHGGEHAGMKHEGMAMDGQPGGMKHRMAGRGGKGGHMMMRMADADKDGTVTRAEFVSASLKRFDMTDANKDGSVSPEERKAAMQKMHEHMKDMRGKMGRQPA